MRYKKCRCGEYVFFEENEIAPRKCGKCSLDLGYESFTYLDDEKIKMRSENKDKNIFFLEDIEKKYIINIPNDAYEIVIGRNGLGPKERGWGLNISRTHLLISVKMEMKKVVVMDVSLNGTRLNGKKMEKNTPFFLDEEDVLTLDAILNDVSLILKKRG